jgi:hypothetical protein
MLCKANPSVIQFYIADPVSKFKNSKRKFTKRWMVHIVGIYDGTNQKLYINGTQKSNKSKLHWLYSSDKIG